MTRSSEFRCQMRHVHSVMFAAPDDDAHRAWVSNLRRRMARLDMEILRIEKPTEYGRILRRDDMMRVLRRTSYVKEIRVRSFHETPTDSFQNLGVSDDTLPWWIQRQAQSRSRCDWWVARVRTSEDAHPMLIRYDSTRYECDYLLAMASVRAYIRWKVDVNVGRDAEFLRKLSESLRRVHSDFQSMDPEDFEKAYADEGLDFYLLNRLSEIDDLVHRYDDISVEKE